MSSGLGRNPNLVCLDDLRRWDQLKVELSVFARLRVGIEDRCLDDSIDSDSDFVNANCQASGAVVACSVGLNNPGKLLPFVAPIRTSAPLTGCPVGSFTTPSRADVPPQALNAKRSNRRS
jgi:hypothetical protein